MVASDGFSFEFSKKTSSQRCLQASQVEKWGVHEGKYLYALAVKRIETKLQTHSLLKMGHHLFDQAKSHSIRMSLGDILIKGVLLFENKHFSIIERFGLEGPLKVTHPIPVTGRETFY